MKIEVVKENGQKNHITTINTFLEVLCSEAV